MALYRQTVEDHGLYSGKELDEQAMTALKSDAGKMSAKMRAVRIVAAAGVSKNDLQRRLIAKGERSEDAQEAVAWMAQMGVLDDKKTAEQIVSRCISKGYGLARAKQALYEKRIPKNLWQEVLEDYPEQEDKILDFLHSRLGEDWDQKDLRKAIDALMRRGHTYQQIRSALVKLDENADLQEEF